MTWRWWHYLAVAFGSGALTWLLTPLAASAAQKLGILDRPSDGEHKSHKAAVPYLGGLAVLSAFLCSVAVPVIIEQSGEAQRQVALAIGVAVALSLVGLIDDVRSLPFSFRLLLETGAALVIWQIDAKVEFTSSEQLNLILTIFWVIGITNAFNLMDNMDGLSAGTAGICSMSFFAVAISNEQFLVAGIAIAVAGSAFGFLRHNFHPARIYMGDGGALFYGFMVAFLALKAQYSQQHSMPYLAPLLIVAIPVLDTSLVTVARLRHRRSPFQGGRDHLSHRLLLTGFTIRTSALLIYLPTFACGVLGFVVARTDQVSALILFVFTALSVAALGVVLYQVPVYGVGPRKFYRFEKYRQES